VEEPDSLLIITAGHLLLLTVTLRIQEKRTVTLQKRAYGLEMQQT